MIYICTISATDTKALCSPENSCPRETLIQCRHVWQSLLQCLSATTEKQLDVHQLGKQIHKTWFIQMTAYYTALEWDLNINNVWGKNPHKYVQYTTYGYQNIDYILLMYHRLILNSFWLPLWEERTLTCDILLNQKHL